MFITVEVQVPVGAVEMMSRKDWSRYLGKLASKNYDKFCASIEMDTRLKEQGVSLTDGFRLGMHELTEDPTVLTYY